MLSECVVCGEDQYLRDGLKTPVKCMLRNEVWVRPDSICISCCSLIHGQLDLYNVPHRGLSDLALNSLLLQQVDIR